ncbi:MAG: maleylpyruvate isomerase N-terminal domain-containing protein [Propionibacteriaceae bacterium]|nr:maleylpyruvate isomerase N-terminal domain-containing protein [Propionibacteriaceae bacterium]
MNSSPPTRGSEGWSRVLAARDRFVDAARVAGPDAPTLCSGWTVRHLVGHLLTLRRDPLSWPGVAFPPLAALTERRMDAATASGFEEALGRLAGRSPFMPLVFDTPRSAWGHHLGEYAVHTEDIVRANALPITPLDDATLVALWRRSVVVARQLHRRAGRGLVLTWPAAGLEARALPGVMTDHVVGSPLELLVWAHRGPEAADVRVVRAP